MNREVPKNKLDARSTRLAQDKRLDAVPVQLYAELYWWLVGVLAAAPIDDWTTTCVHNTLDRLELEVM